MEVYEQTENSSFENQEVAKIEHLATKKVVAPRKAAVRKTAVKPIIEAENVPAELDGNNEMIPTKDLEDEIESISYQNLEKSNKKTLKKSKQMKEKEKKVKEKVKEKEKKAKDNQKEKEKKAKKKKKDKAKKEKAKKKLKEKKAKKKAASKKKKSKK